MSLHVLPVVDPDAVVVSAPDCALTFAELESWSNRLARLLLGLGAGPGARIAVALDSPVEEVVAERAATKLEATLLHVDAGVSALGATHGITQRDRRADLPGAIDWLVLDDPFTLRRYLAGSDAPVTAADLAATRRTA